jgi:uncharacterized protein YndB with AHSA1/START domain
MEFKELKPKRTISYKAIGISVAVTTLLDLISIEWIYEYGTTVFILSPVLLGFLPPFIIGRQGPISLRDSLKNSFLAMWIALACLILFAMEGIICIAMALPIIALFLMVGSYIGYITAKKGTIGTKNTLMILLLVSAGTMGFDSIDHPEKLIPVRTSVTINAPIETVWENVVTFDKIPEPTDWLFSTGVAYPITATIKGEGVGAIRYCNFTTGSFVEPITVWDEPNLLSFDVLEQPVPMNEFNPFWDIHPKHLDGYFNSHKGQFKLTRIGKNKTKLEGTTWYTVDITPVFYWGAWSDFILHRIHKRVLNHIKKESEKKS